MGDEPRGFRGLAGRLYRKVTEDGAGYVAGAAWTLMVGWIWPRTAEIRDFAAGHPSTAAAIVILLGFSLYGIADASLRAWRWARRRPGPAALPVAGDTSRPVAVKAEPTYWDWRAGMLESYGLRARWGWTGDGKAAGAVALCPECFAELTPVALKSEAHPNAYPRTAIFCMRGHWNREFPEQPHHFPARLEEEITRMKDSGEWKAALRKEREREAAI